MAYFILSWLYSAVVPLIVSIYTILIGTRLPQAWSIDSLFAISMLVLAVCFGAMMFYGYRIMQAHSPKKPSSMFGIYLPVFMPLLWFTFWAGIFNVLNWANNSGITQSLFLLLTLNMFCGLKESESFAFLDSWHITLLMGLVYYCVNILGFAVGERIATHKWSNEQLKPLRHHRKQIAIGMIIVFCAYTFSEFIYFDQRKNILTTPRPSYHFAFEGGYSSIDLRPYYVENEENILAKLNEPSTFQISDPQKMPVLDGAEAAYPVYSAFANACYENIVDVQLKAKKPQSDSVMPIQFNNTIYAFDKLLTGEIDIFFGAKPSEKQLQMAEEAGVELVLTPIGKEAFVFFVNIENPVDNLNSDQLRAIYSGEINNWRKVGGQNKKILAFQRPENSGSQTMMKYFMGDPPLREPLEREYVQEMGGIVRKVADYENNISSIGYSFRYYTAIMMAMADSTEEVEGIKLLGVDGVFPDTETIQSGEYPFITELYAITVIDSESRKYSKDSIEPFLAWMIGPQGQQIVADTGYVALE